MPHRPTLVRWLLPALACLATDAAWGPDARAQDEGAVATIEAAYLTKFAAFVEWPPAAAAGPATLCVAAPDPVADLIEQAESKLPSDAGTAVVRRVASPAETAGCRILFAEAAQPGPETPTLVVTDRAAAGHKGVINFVVRDDRVRFEIDDAEAQRRGLVISSKLLSLAVAVKPRA